MSSTGEARSGPAQATPSTTTGPTESGAPSPDEVLDRLTLTTAESLVARVLLGQLLLGREDCRLSNRHWIQPQLESLAGLGVLTWEFDENADFRIRPTQALTRALQRRTPFPAAAPVAALA